MVYTCTFCDYITEIQSTYSHHKKSKKHLEKVTKSNNDNTLNHSKTPINTLNNPENVNIYTNLTCKFCLCKFTRVDNLMRHQNKYCSSKKIENIKTEYIMKDKDKEIESLKNKCEEYKKELSIIKNNIDKPNTNNININNELIDIIIEKNKKLDELNNKMLDRIIHNSDSNCNNNYSITINETSILCRNTDNYINATSLCNATNKKFNDWFNLETTKNIIDDLEVETGIHPSKLVNEIKNKKDVINSGIWIHSKLALHLAQWISPEISMQINNWIFDIIYKDKMEKSKKIKQLENLVIQKQKRNDYPEKNVIYIITTEDNKKKGIYIVGKAKELTNRLSTYNKTCEHEVTYYKSCENEKYMNLIELMVLSKLDKYREKANRDRFILPKNKDISYFTNIIDESINFIKQ